MDCTIPVEIRGKYGEFYPGYVVGYNNPDSFVFRFAGDNSSGFPNEIVVSPSCLRKTPKVSKQKLNEEDISVGQVVEVLIGKLPQDNSLSCVIDKCPPSWWSAKVAKQRGDFVILEFSESKNHMSEKGYATHDLPFPCPSLETIVERNQIRHRSTEKMLSFSDLYSHVLEIPKDLVEVFKDPKSIEHLIRICGQSMLLCEVTPELVLPPEHSKIDINDASKTHFLVLCTSAEVIFKAQTLGQEIVKMLRQKLVILHQISELSRKLKESQSHKSDSLIFEEFKVAPDLVGQSIGARGANISRARALDGVVSVVLNPETCAFKVFGKTREAVESAKKVLEYATEVMQVPREYVSRIIGQKNRHIQSLVDRVGLAKIRVQSAEEATVPHCVPFAFTGTRSAINDARLLINFNIDCLREIDHIQEMVIPHYQNRFTDGEGNQYRPERSSKPFGDGKQGSGGRRGYHTNLSDSTTFNGDGVHTSETEQYSDVPHSKSFPIPRRYTGRPPRNTNQGHQLPQPHQTSNDSRQSSLPPPAPKSGGVVQTNNRANYEMSTDQQKQRGSENLARRMGRRQPGNSQNVVDSRPRPIKKPSRENVNGNDLHKENGLPQYNGVPIDTAT